MTTQEAIRPRNTPVRRGVQREKLLPRRTRKAVLVAHLVGAGGWIGLDVVLAVLVFTAAGTSDVALAALCYQALELLVWPMLSLAVLCLVSGVILGLGTKYGLVRYWWVAVKLVLNIALLVLVTFALRSGVIEVAEYGRQLAAGQVGLRGPGDLIYPPIVSTTALLFATVISVYKPWGRLRKK
ncbi:MULTISPECIES: hypothetical protein [unclassified Crossiella]|uniref:hypothetical protein n=1 Tax=unclassified Crossiella TaxID=2620835 RepID=UPI001FFF4440|nr:MULTISPECIES: hypothetical protein [unclassified Crossiella]MCK2241376.1 hypothetical protein [Crossiella sp. S99.2]MCK2253480.1 hypothetical protein [Crossiella sp. S99.1]